MKIEVKNTNKKVLYMAKQTDYFVSNLVIETNHGSFLKLRAGNQNHIFNEKLLWLGSINVGHHLTAREIYNHYERFLSDKLSRSVLIYNTYLTNKLDIILKEKEGTNNEN